MWEKKSLPGFKQGSDLFSELLQRCARIQQPRPPTLTFTANLDGLDRFLCRFVAPATSLNTPATGMLPLSKRNIPPQPRETLKKTESQILWHISAVPPAVVQKADSDALSQHLIEFNISVRPGDKCVTRG